MKKLSLRLMLVGITLSIGAFAQSPQNNTWYRLENGQNKKSIANNGATDVGSVVVAKSTVGNGGHWMLIPMGNGTYRIKNKYSGMFMANFGQQTSGAPIKQTNNPGSGALWTLRQLQGGYYMIINDHSGLYLGLGGQEDNATIIQTNRSSGMTTWRFAPVQANGGASASANPANSSWSEASLPSQFYGNWKIFSRSSSRNDVKISGTNIMDGLVNMRIVKTYYKDGVYKVITTLNNYYQCHYFKIRNGGYTGNGKGIYLNSTNSHAFTTFQQAMNVPLPSSLDEGYR
ncbi:MAG: RICIN domain-containing protein [Cyclobacteriaceae bacterium]|nr:RICIN domain-containing protein [Cyclobacteriaceae bacterium]